jgi:hypothetical protein
MATVSDAIKKQKEKYNTKGNTFDMFPIGTKVQVITKCQDFNFFSGTETGTVIGNKYRYLAISVKFDKPKHFKGGDVQESFGFNPDDLIVIKRETCEAKGDLMLLGTLRCPVDDHGDIAIMQLVNRAAEAADRIEADALKIAALKLELHEEVSDNAH